MQVASGATLDLNGYSQVIDSLADDPGSGGTVTTGVAGPVTLTLAPAGVTTPQRHHPGWRRPMSLTLAGPGVQVLTGNNTYHGATTINGGTLEVAGTIPNSSALAGAAGAMLQLDTGGSFTAPGGNYQLWRRAWHQRRRCRRS